MLKRVLRMLLPITPTGKFPKSVCTSVNECVCHGIPDSRPLQDGDIVNIDVTVYLDVRLFVPPSCQLLALRCQAPCTQ